MQCLVLITVLLMTSSGAADDMLKAGRPVSNAPVDCNADYQPCTGTECVSQTRIYYCDDEDNTGQVVQLQCANDTQTYTGGSSTCCTGYNICGTCKLNGRNYTIYGYNAANRSCGGTQ